MDLIKTLMIIFMLIPVIKPNTIDAAKELTKLVKIEKQLKGKRK